MRQSQGEQRPARIHDLELTWRDDLHEAELIHRDEDTRRAKLRLLCLQDEKALLQEEARQRDYQHRQLMKTCDQLHLQLDAAREKARSQEIKLKKQVLEMGSLQAELSSLGTSMQDSGKVLQEKLTLSRELDRLRPELEHAQSQLTNHQAVIAEKHRLQRQLDTLEVELENEKRSRHRVQDKESKMLADELRSRVDHVQRCLASEKKEKEKMRTEYELALSEANGLNEQSEQRLVALKEKLGEVQAELKKAKAETAHRRTVLEPTQPSVPGPRTSASTRISNRQSEESSFQEITIETPGNGHKPDRFATKKTGGRNALVGQKSSFSVTPFLNRNKGSAPNTQGADLSKETIASNTEDDTTGGATTQEGASKPIEATDHLSGVSSHSKVADAPKPRKPRGRPRAQPLTEAEVSNTNTAVPAKDSHAQDNLQAKEPASVVDQENNTLRPTEQTDAQLNPLKREAQRFGLGPESRNTAGGVDGKKRRRKLLGAGNTTLFDEEEDGPAEGTAQNYMEHATKRKRTHLGGVSNAFAGASFSPLKRDRRGVGASFLT